MLAWSNRLKQIVQCRRYVFDFRARLNVWSCAFDLFLYIYTYKIHDELVHWNTYRCWILLSTIMQTNPCAYCIVRYRYQFINLIDIDLHIPMWITIFLEHTDFSCLMFFSFPSIAFARKRWSQEWIDISFRADPHLQYDLCLYVSKIIWIRRINTNAIHTVRNVFALG